MAHGSYMPGSVAWCSAGGTAVYVGHMLAVSVVQRHLCEDL